MCGIAGVASMAGRSTINLAGLEAMTDSLLHRGPDEAGHGICDGVALGMRRLSIIDLEGGSQPLYNEDHSIRVVFNGEIYNHRELRRGLEARGHQLVTQTDGEVIAHLWEELGPRFPSVLNGMFAIALHDVRAKRVVLVRDHFGIKPLYYGLVDGRLVFGSEVKALLSSGLVPRELDLDALGEFLSWEYVPAPRTLLRHVRKLLPGAMVEFDLTRGVLTESVWWQLPSSTDGAPSPVSEREWEAAVDAQLREAVQRQLISDVPLGAFLSGGVDSSLVVAAPTLGPTRWPSADSQKTPRRCRRVFPFSAWPHASARIVLDNEGSLALNRDLLPLGDLPDPNPPIVLVQFEICRRPSHFQRGGEGDHIPTPLGQGDHVSRLEPAGRPIDFPAIDGHVTVGHRLPCGVNRSDEPGPQHDGVQPELEQLKQPNARVTGLPDGLGKGVLQLALAHIVLSPEPLLLHQLLLVAADFSAGRGAMLPWRIGTALHDSGRLGRECNAQLTGQFNLWSPTIHDSFSSGMVPSKRSPLTYWHNTILGRGPKDGT
jgi:hypothetical protein